MTEQPHLPLARKYRPRRFEGDGGLVGQPHVARILKNALRADRVANAYLLAGPRGTGKTTAARILAAALNCPERSQDGEPCGRCDRCQRILGGKETPDVIEIDAATNRSAEDARSLRQSALYAPSTDQAHKVYILDECHMLTREGWNALLKIIEEPPPRVHFAFCTTEPQKIQQAAPAILSRCQRLDMRRISHAEISAHLRWVCERESIRATEEAIAVIARRAEGGMRDALSILDQLWVFQEDGEITVEAIRKIFGFESERTLLGVLDLIATKDRGRVFKLLRHLEASGSDFVQFIDDWIATLSTYAMIQEGGVAEGWSANAQAEFARRAGSRLLPTALVAELMALGQAEARGIRQADHPATLVLTLLQRSITLVERWEKEEGMSKRA